jgi:minor histocompatibility antigen H13
MLGLGDIVVPGLVVALCLRFDLAQYAKRYPAADATSRSSFPKPYFTVGVLSYIVGLATTITVMHRWKAAQPALLYLSPACSECLVRAMGSGPYVGPAPRVRYDAKTKLMMAALGPVLLALARGELKDLWKWSDSHTSDTVANESGAKRDETIEAPSEAAMRARQAVEEDKQEAVAHEVVDHVEQMDAAATAASVAEDESWMEGGVGTPAEKGKKKKGGKRR